jgi:hypothetical protein
MIDSIRKGVVIILSTSSHVNVKECIIKKKWWKERVIQLFSSTTRLLCCYSRSHFFFFFFSSSPSSYSLIADTNIHIDWPQSKKKKRNSTVFFLLPQRFNYMRKNAILTFSFNLVLVCLIFIQVYINELCLMTTHIIIIEFETKTNQTKATDKEIEFLVCIASR